MDYKCYDLIWKAAKRKQEMDRISKYPSYYTSLWDDAIKEDKIRNKAKERTPEENALHKKNNMKLREKQRYTSEDNRNGFMDHVAERVQRSEIWAEIRMNKEISPCADWEF